ncbi:MAG: helicase-related protein, partial [Cycloclasticus sp.]
ELLKQLVRKAGLYPYLKSEFESLDIEDIILIENNKPSLKKDFVFHETQKKIYNELILGRNIILSAPTSMGKSAILPAILNAKIYRKVVLIVPTIALIDETRKKISAELGHKYKVIHHNCQTYNNDVPTVFILTQERLNQRQDIDSIDLFILDEFYKLGFKYNKNGDLQYDERAISLNISVSKLITKSKQWFFIGPNISNVKGLSNIVGDYTFISSDFRTVSVNLKEYHIPSTDILKKKNTLLKILESNNNEKTIIYCRSPRSANDVANFLACSKKYEIKYSDDLINWIEKSYDPHWSYCNALKSRIVLHHGTLPRAIQHLSLDIFDNSPAHNILICTSTIIEGVNTRAKNVIIFDSHNGIKSLDRFTHNNIKGRAGRMNKHFIGNVHCLGKQPPDDCSDELIIPLGSQDNKVPLNMLGSIDEEHLSQSSQQKWDDYKLEAVTPIEIIKRNSSFEIEKVEEVFNSINSLLIMDYERYKDLNFHSMPTTSALRFIIELFIAVKPKVLTSNGLAIKYRDGRDPINAINGKIRSYLSANSLTEYLKGQVSWKRDDILSKKLPYDETYNLLSTVIDNELKVISNVYGFSLPNFISLMGDIIFHLNSKYKTRLSFDYKEIIQDFEFQKLSPGYSALNEMGIPHQTIEKITDAAVNIDGESIEEICLFINNNLDTIPGLTHIDKKFIGLAKI